MLVNMVKTRKTSILYDLWWPYKTNIYIPYPENLYANIKCQNANIKCQNANIKLNILKTVAKTCKTTSTIQILLQK